MIHRLPQDILNLVVEPLSATERLRLRQAGLHIPVQENVQLHDNIWNTIFKKDDWCERMLQLECNPLLLGCFLTKIAHGSDNRETYYLCLIVDDWHGDAQYERRLLFDPLHEHTLHKTDGDYTHEVMLNFGIRLNIYDAVHCPETIPVNASLLFQGKRLKSLKTECVYWKDEAHKIYRLHKSSIVPWKTYDSRAPFPWVRPSNSNFICMLSLPHPKGYPLERREGPRLKAEGFSLAVNLIW